MSRQREHYKIIKANVKQKAANDERVVANFKSVWPELFRVPDICNKKGKV